MRCYSIIVDIHLPDQLIFQASLLWVLSYLLEAQLLPNYKMSKTHSLTGRLVVSAISPLRVDRFERS